MYTASRKSTVGGGNNIKTVNLPRPMRYPQEDIYLYCSSTNFICVCFLVALSWKGIRHILINITIYQSSRVRAEPNLDGKELSTSCKHSSKIIPSKMLGTEEKVTTRLIINLNTDWEVISVTRAANCVVHGWGCQGYYQSYNSDSSLYE